MGLVRKRTSRQGKHYKDRPACAFVGCRVRYQVAVGTYDELNQDVVKGSPKNAQMRSLLWTANRKTRVRRCYCCFVGRKEKQKADVRNTKLNILSSTQQQNLDTNLH